jgi:Flp pilus assembly protein CpaB
VLAVLAAGFGYEALQGRAAMTSIVVADAAVPFGSPIDAGDTRVVNVHATDRALIEGVLGPSQLAGDWVAAVAIRAGEPVTLSEVRSATSSPALGEMSIAVPVQQAVGGHISAGDLVDVISTNGAGAAHYVVQGLRVVSVAPVSGLGSAFGGGAANGAYYVVVAVDKWAALRVAAALGAQNSATGGGDIEIVRSTGEATSETTSYPVKANAAAQRAP